MPDITITDDDIITVTLPGLAAVRIDARSRVIAVDGISGTLKGTAPIHPEWIVHDLRGGTYGDFHRLKDRGDCFDPHDHTRPAQG